MITFYVEAILACYNFSSRFYQLLMQHKKRFFTLLIFHKLTK